MDRSFGSRSGSASSPDPLTQTCCRRTASAPSAFLAPAFNACASATSEVDPALLRLSRQNSAAAAATRRVLKSSPLSPIANLGIEEEVLVMDDVLVSESKRANFTPRRNNSGEFANNSGGAVFKMELCRGWEDAGVCRYGFKCQFAHGKEELRCHLRGPRSWKLKSEALGSFVSKYTPSPGFLPHNSKSHRYVSLPGPNTPDPSLTATPEKITPAKTIKEATPINALPTTTFNWPPTEKEDKLITRVLYGPSTRRRLPCVGWSEIHPRQFGPGTNRIPPAIEPGDADGPLDEARTSLILVPTTVMVFPSSN